MEPNDQSRVTVVIFESLFFNTSRYDVHNVSERFNC